MEDKTIPPLTLPDANVSKKPRSRIQTVLSFLFFFTLSLIVGYGIGSLIDSEIKLSGLELGLLVIGSIIGFLFVILLHELGHLLGGKLVGFRFVLLIVGPLKVTRSASGPQFGLNRSLALAGGIAASFPTSNHNLRAGFLSMIAGGPITSLVCGLLFLLPGLILQPMDNEITVGYLLLQILGIASLTISLGTLIPSETGGLKSDGSRLLELWRNDPAAMNTNLITLLSANSMAGIRPRDWDDDLINQLLTSNSEPNNLTPTIASFLYAHALDKNDLTTARKQLQRLLDSNHLQPAVAQTAVWHNAAFFEAWVRQDLAQAEQFMAQAGKDGFSEPQTRLLAQTAVALLRQEFDKTKSLLDEAEKALEKTMDPGIAHLTSDQIAAIRMVAEREN
ncbi:site-2 protease family protein [Candidatus Leptofilum sp.]|uniref:site-2 protease family protein n=1 Tax=Candidatus Leptofilum sp. TaxID=3241576 RepID=UPI003B5BA378